MKNNNRRSRLLLLFIESLSLPGIATPSNAAVYSRISGKSVFDSDFNVTWTADANLAATLPFGRMTVQPNGQPFQERVSGSIFGAQITKNWIYALSVYQDTGYLGLSNEQLTIDHCTNTAGYSCTNSEIG